MRELERNPRHPRAGRPALPPTALIGRGRMGGALERAGSAAGLDLRAAGRDDFQDAAREARVALLCVPDAEIAGACERLAACVPPLEFVGHVSGATGLGALEAAAAHGARTFSLHPLQTVPDPATDLTGTPAAIAGSDAEATELARELARALGMEPFEVPEQARAAYHAAASMASNFLVALEECAAEVLEAAGVEQPRELLTPLVLRTAANWAERGGAALTGPIARGDTATIDRHREALRSTAPELLEVYEALALATERLAARDADGAGASGRATAAAEALR
jgi:predicted short-subunit dehydrogenase-like oxidoreductase (DUF2520 family)